MTPTHADWEALRNRRNDVSYELALAVKAKSHDANHLADTVIHLTEQMSILDDLISAAGA